MSLTPLRSLPSLVALLMFATTACSEGGSADRVVAQAQTTVPAAAPEGPSPETVYQELKSRVHNRLFDALDLAKLSKVSEERIRQDVAIATARILEEEKVLLTLDERDRFVREIQDEVFGLGPLEPLLADPSVTDILVNGHRQIYVERRGRLEATSARFKDDTHLIIVATSDRGLAGAFNSNIVRAARRKADELIDEGKTVLFYIVGRKGRPVIQRLYPKQIIAQYDTSEMKAPTYAHAQAIAKDIIDRFTTDGIDVVHLAYANFRSTLVQEPAVEQIIPVPPSEAEAAAATAKSGPPAAVEYEPDEEEILADLLPRNVAVQLYHALLENQAGFYGSQMTAMDNATRNAGDMINRLSIQYNRQRQAAITTELVEIISGAEAL